MRLRVEREQLRVFLEHLLVVRDVPLAGRRIAEETAGDAVVHAAARHRREGLVDHGRELRVTETAVLVEDEAQHFRLRELRLAPEAAELGIVGAANV